MDQPNNMRPANISQAQQQMRKLLERKIPGRRATKVKAHQKRAATIADTLYRHFQVGPYQYQVKHLRWYLETQTRHLKTGSRYRHWLTIQQIVTALNKQGLWESLLEGSWKQPESSNLPPEYRKN